jgi:betaine-aldehyde dehydrogenase
MDIINPLTQQVIQRVPIYNNDQLNEVVQTAHEVQKSWERTPSQIKGEYLREIAEKLSHYKSEIAKLLSTETGKPLVESIEELDMSIGVYRFYSEVGRLVQGSVVPPMQEKTRNYILKEALGVVGAIIPFNYPHLLLSWKVAPALMAGCTVVAKPPHQNPLSTLLFEELCLKHLPKGVLSVITGDGSTGSCMVEHPLIRVIAFTGSTAVGRKIAERCGALLKRAHLEMGGMDPLVVLDDADLEMAARGACYARFHNSGQVCTSAKRIIVTRGIADKFVARFVELVSQLRQGNPLEDVDLGPMISKEGLDKVASQVEILRLENNVKVLVGGQRNKKLPNGFFYEPTVIDGLTSSSYAHREEIFGPIACIFRVENKEEAFNLANSSEYGLGASLFSNRLDSVMEFTEQVKGGTVWVNDVLSDNDGAPFGGMRNSGDGSRELGGLESLDAYRESKHVHIDYSNEIKSSWFPYKYIKL